MNDKLILENQRIILFLSSEESKNYLCSKCSGAKNIPRHGLYCREQMIKVAIEKIDNTLNPKEVVPYAESLFLESSSEEKK